MTLSCLSLSLFPLLFLLTEALLPIPPPEPLAYALLFFIFFFLQCLPLDFCKRRGNFVQVSFVCSFLRCPLLGACNPVPRHRRLMSKPGVYFQCPLLQGPSVGGHCAPSNEMRQLHTPFPLIQVNSSPLFVLPLLSFFCPILFLSYSLFLFTFTSAVLTII